MSNSYYVKKFNAKCSFKPVLDMDIAVSEKPWTVDEFRKVLNKKTVKAFTIETNKSVTGFIILENIKNGVRIVKFESLIKDPKSTQVNRLLAYTIDLLKNGQKECKFIQAEVPESNLSTQLILKSCNFKCTEILKKYFKDTKEDAYLMVLNFNQ